MATKQSKSDTINGTGRRKTAVARVRIAPGSGRFTVNSRDIESYFPHRGECERVRAPLRAVSREKDLDVFVRVDGGGYTGQSGAAALGLARALLKYDSEFEEALRANKFLTVDARRTERKKYGRAGARRSFQFSKR